jgi:hypothetical protein
VQLARRPVTQLADAISQFLADGTACRRDLDAG